eukprot:COSAG02_NODE_29314_length_571_cov_1.667373_1_plen_93_part_01
MQAGLTHSGVAEENSADTIEHAQVVGGAINGVDVNCDIDAAGTTYALPDTGEEYACRPLHGFLRGADAFGGWTHDVDDTSSTASSLPETDVEA